MIKTVVSISVVLIAVCSVAHGAATCIRSRTPIFVIKKSVPPTSVSANATDMTFTLNFGYDLVPGNSSYRTITGLATCNEIATDTSGANVTQGGVNTHLRASAGDAGTRCWCELTGPVTSWWVYNREYDNSSLCSASCASDCANAIKNNTNNFLTNGIYRAIW